MATTQSHMGEMVTKKYINKKFNINFDSNLNYI